MATGERLRGRLYPDPQKPDDTVDRLIRRMLERLYSKPPISDEPPKAQPELHGDLW